jgi:SAM-dependent methyltransferase
MNRRWATSLSSTTHERLQLNATAWYAYHTRYREARQDWPEMPCEVIAETLKVRSDWVVGDFGCGEALLAETLPNRVHSFDHVAINDGVVVCDMAHTPLEDGVLDVAVYSLSLMGTNWREYLAEAYRVLKAYGWLRIAEPISCWEGAKRAELLPAIRAAGFQVVEPGKERDRFMYMYGAEPVSQLSPNLFRIVSA